MKQRKSLKTLERLFVLRYILWGVSLFGAMALFSYPLFLFSLVRLFGFAFVADEVEELRKWQTQYKDLEHTQK